MTNEILYKKQGRKYVPAYDVLSTYDRDYMRVGTWRMTYAYDNGARRYEYDVQPANAKPCEVCEAMLKAFGVKIVQHTTDNGLEEYLV